MFCLKRGKEVWWVIQSSSKSLWQLKLHRSQTDIKKVFLLMIGHSQLWFPLSPAEVFELLLSVLLLVRRRCMALETKLFFPLWMCFCSVFSEWTHITCYPSRASEHIQKTSKPKKKKHPSLTWISLSRKLFRTTLEGPCTVTVPDFFQLLRNKMCLVTV